MDFLFIIFFQFHIVFMKFRKPKSLIRIHFKLVRLLTLHLEQNSTKGFSLKFKSGQKQY